MTDKLKSVAVGKILEELDKENGCERYKRYNCDFEKAKETLKFYLTKLYTSSRGDIAAKEFNETIDKLDRELYLLNIPISEQYSRSKAIKLMQTLKDVYAMSDLENAERFGCFDCWHGFMGRCQYFEKYKHEHACPKHSYYNKD